MQSCQVLLCHSKILLYGGQSYCLTVWEFFLLWQIKQNLTVIALKFVQSYCHQTTIYSLIGYGDIIFASKCIQIV